MIVAKFQVRLGRTIFGEELFELDEVEFLLSTSGTHCMCL